MSSGSSCISGITTLVMWFHVRVETIFVWIFAGNSSISNSSNSSTQSGVSSVSSKTNATDNLHRHHGSCSSGCMGAIPRNSQYGNKRYGHHQSKGRLSELQNRLPPIKEFRSPTKVPMPSPTHLNNPKLRCALTTCRIGCSVMNFLNSQICFLYSKADCCQWEHSATGRRFYETSYTKAGY